MLKTIRERYPFEIGTTSYILHIKKDNLIRNVEFLKNNFQKIQLLFFEKDNIAEFMNEETLERLQKIKKESGIKYSIHLPLDLNLLNSQQESTSLDIVKLIVQKTSFLEINEYILHIDRSDRLKNPGESIRDTFESLLIKIRNVLKEDYKKILIENTSYDLTQFEDLIKKYDFSICMDLGHLIVNNFNLENFIEVFKKTIREVHLYGYSGGSRHVSLSDELDSKLKPAITFLKQYKKSVIIEVFCLKDLKTSLKYLERQFII